MKQPQSKAIPEATPQAPVDPIPTSSAITTVMVPLKVELKLLGAPCNELPFPQ